MNTSYLKAVWTIFNTLPDKRGTGNGADFYRLVGAHGYDKTERAYERLSEALNRARRARLIPMASIRDGGGARVDPDFWRDTDQFLRSYRAAAERCDVYLTELKAAAIETVAIRARAEGARVVFIRNRPVGVDDALVKLYRDAS